MRIAIVGTGYVGLVTGTCFSEMGFDVLCVDIDEKKVDQLKRGVPTIYETGLEMLLQRNIKEGRLNFTTQLREAALTATVLFLALPTPPGGDGEANLTYVRKAASDLADIWASESDSGYRVVVNKSTVPVGTADIVKRILESRGLVGGEHFDVVSNPEFLREGVAVSDFMKPERVVIGTTSERAADIMKTIYEPFVRQGNPILVMDERSSEMTKYAANSFLATKISFINEVANLCDEVGANVDQVRQGIGMDIRIGNLFLYPGIGFGGSCFPKDVQALKKTADDIGYDFKILDAVLKVNDRQRQQMADRIIDRFGGSLVGKKIAVWGLAFKARTDDVRESPAHYVIRGLLEKGAKIVAFDPEAIETTRAVFGDSIEYGSEPYQVLEGADALAVLTEWHEFRRPDFDRVKSLLREPVVFDGRNLFKPYRMADMGFEYYSVGRPN
ncbi:MAG: UDP-glucose/GDP-mannose dehydrogenase family protein [Bacteroidota bacterium]|nr:UDP-glucose/GDP-mannose dehydrogenase family protein [Bacteroidota bacterium]